MSQHLLHTANGSAYVMNAAYEPAWTVGESLDLRRDFMHPAILALLLAAHAGLGVLLFRMESLSTIHALLTLAIGAGLTLLSKKPEVAASAAGYAAGSECVWRLTHAQVFWEFGKYSAAVILLLALYRMERPKLNGTALIYFALLLPSAVITLAELPLEEARQRLSFNLSGPFLLAVAFVALGNSRMAVVKLHRVFAFAIMPIASVAAIALYSTLTASNVKFSNDSNFVTSGGFGPNQVSAALGLGAFIVILCLLDERPGLWLRTVLFAVLLWFVVQSGMTFSRSGLYLAVSSVALAMWYLVRLSQVRLMLLRVLPLLLVVVLFAWPYIDNYTEGALAERFTDTNLTHRDELVYDDWLIFLDNPVFGAGPGMGMASRMGLAAHTEFSRMFSEHGLCGAAALVLMAVMMWRRFAASQSNLEKGYVVSMFCWGILYMAVNGMRLAAPSLICGVACVQLTDGWSRK
jgi:O-antigen ligase